MCSMWWRPHGAALVMAALLVSPLGCESDRTPPPDGPAPAGRACERDEDCLSGWCIDLPSGRACAESCAGACAAGFVCKRADGRDPTSAAVCVPPTSNLCQRCEEDSNCGPYGDLCLPRDGAFYCASDCTETLECPDSFVCESVREAGVEISRQCAPRSGTCTCNSANEGALGSCEKTVPGVGTCTGTTVCDPEAGWVSCDARTPIPELCDGQDNDCDLDVDEGVDGQPLSKPCGYGPEPRRQECTAYETCHNGIWSACPLPPPPAQETACDGHDDDCDGQVDEGVLHNVDNCASCGDVCPPGPAGDATTVRSCESSDSPHFCGPIKCRVPHFDVNGQEADGCEVTDDHRAVGDTIVLNNSWPAAFTFSPSSTLLCGEGKSLALCDRRLPRDERQHLPVQPPEPNTDYFYFDVEDPWFGCGPHPWICVSFGSANPADWNGQVEVCGSTQADAVDAAPSFPPERCMTFDLTTGYGVLLRLWETGESIDEAYYYVRVRSGTARYSGRYAVSAFHFEGTDFTQAELNCPLFLAGDPCRYD